MRAASDPVRSVPIQDIAAESDRTRHAVAGRVVVPVLRTSVDDSGGYWARQVIRDAADRAIGYNARPPQPLEQRHRYPALHPSRGPLHAAQRLRLRPDGRQCEICRATRHSGAGDHRRPRSGVTGAELCGRASQAYPAVWHSPPAVVFAGAGGLRVADRGVLRTGASADCRGVGVAISAPDVYRADRLAVAEGAADPGYAVVYRPQFYRPAGDGAPGIPVWRQRRRL